MSSTSDVLSASDIKRINTEMDKLIKKLNMVHKELSGIKTDVLAIDELNIIESDKTSKNEEESLSYGISLEEFQSLDQFAQNLRNNLIEVSKFNGLEIDITINGSFDVLESIEEFSVNYQKSLENYQESWNQIFNEIQLEMGNLSVSMNSLFDMVQKRILELNIETRMENVRKMMINVCKSVGSISNNTNEQTSTSQEESGGFNWLDIVNFINQELAGILFEEMIKKLAKNMPDSKEIGPFVKKIGKTILLGAISVVGKAIEGIFSLLENLLSVGTGISDFIKNIPTLLKTVPDILKKLVPFLKKIPLVGKVLLPLIISAASIEFGLEVGKESVDLQEKINELGEEEGRIAAGTGYMDRQALFQYDRQQADMAILEAQVFGKSDVHFDGETFLTDLENDAISLYENLQSFFSVETWQEFGNNIRIGIEESWNQFVTWFNETAFGKWINESLLPWFTKEKWLELLGNIQTAVEEYWNQFTEWFNETAFGKWINESLLPWFTKDKWKELLDNIKKAVEEKWDEFTTWFSNTGFGKWINEDVLPWFTEEKWLDILKGVKEAFPKIFEDSINGVVEVINEFIDWVNENLKIEWAALDVDGERIFGAGSFQLFTIPHIPTFSIGGFPEDGLFMANHNELVGQFSNVKTAVANNEQIVSGIKYGVREAVSEVLAPYLADIAQNTRETANKDFTTYIGDKEIARASERGRRAMGLQLITEF